jgi:hypothetical protein
MSPQGQTKMKPEIPIWTCCSNASYASLAIDTRNSSVEQALAKIASSHGSFCPATEILPRRSPPKKPKIGVPEKDFGLEAPTSLLFVTVSVTPNQVVPLNY